MCPKLGIRGAIFLLAFLCTSSCWGRIRKLDVASDGRKHIVLSTFGFYQGGILDVQLKNFTATPDNDSAVFGFTLDYTTDDATTPYFDSYPDRCILLDRNVNDQTIIYLILELKTKKLRILCEDSQLVHIYQNSPLQKEKDADHCNNLNFDITSEIINGKTYYNARFTLSVATVAEEGLYNLYFHNCPYYHSGTEVSVDFTTEIIEQNINSFLSAGDMPLPTLYILMAILFFLSGIFWIFLLRHPSVFKIHYMMTALVFLKATSLVFRGINYYYIGKLGVQLITWTVLFYAAHVLKGALLVIVLILISTGWTFIKPALTPRDKCLFMVVIPLQVLANVAEVMLETSKDQTREHVPWRNVFVFVDFLISLCILLPCFWSIRHLRSVSNMYGKATLQKDGGGEGAMYLQKLKLFKLFYVMVVCYFYASKIIVYVLKMTVPFQYGWLDEMFREIATYVFFVLTAYKFRPGAHKPCYVFDDDEEIDKMLTEPVNQEL
ncbi:hypothetical protein Zmor_007056 [Zophobas morio]|uniref:GOST seven transmembrane domain-containing protein n=1 Tax=Zophobas morio TaxID=2755281 RepID=A0AA38MP02_9CUCU|nr:hypothetical protein Zmor_007056 [Zophobas morio]